MVSIGRIVVVSSSRVPMFMLSVFEQPIIFFSLYVSKGNSRNSHVTILISLHHTCVCYLFTAGLVHERFSTLAVRCVIIRLLLVHEQLR